MKQLFHRVVMMIFPVMVSTFPLFSQSEETIEMRARLAYDRQSSFVSITEITGGTGISLTDAPYAKYYAGVISSAGYQFTRNIKVGGGTGFHLHNEGLFIPLFLDARFSLNANDFVPFLSAAGGLTFNLADPDNRTWLFINPSIGVRWVAADRRSFSLSAGLMTMAGSINRNSFISLRLGMELKGK